MPDSPLLPVGRIRKAHGIKGEVSADYYADSPELLSDGVFLRHGASAPVLHEVASFRFHNGVLLIHFENVPDRNMAETLRGYEILVPEDRLPEPGDGAIYLHEIMGLRVLAANEDGTEADWGVITAVMEPAGQELWTISRENEEDILFPATPELVLGFDLDERIVRIAPPPGLIDLYRS